MRWRRLWRRLWRGGADAREAREQAEERLRTARRQAPQVRREAQRDVPADEFIDRVARAFWRASS